MQSDSVTGKIDDLVHWLDSVFSTKPLADRLQACRRGAEAICKIAILEHFGAQKGNRIIAGAEKASGDPGDNRPPDLNALIGIVTSAQHGVVSNHQIGKSLRARLDVLRAEGNLASHDRSVGENDPASEAIIIAIPAISLATKWLFDQVVDHPLRADIAAKIESAGISIAQPSKQTRAIEIVQICYPNRAIAVVKDENNWRTKLRYEFITVEVAKNAYVGFLFLGKDAALQNSINKFVESLQQNLVHLTVCSPKKINSETGHLVSRLDSIKEAFRDVRSNCIRSSNIDFFYTDELLWSECLSKTLEKFDFAPDESIFIDQELRKAIGKSERCVASNSLQYAKRLVEQPIQREPLILIGGSAGVGKSTFCKHLAWMINGCEKKRALLISSTDLRDCPPPTQPISNVAELYHYYSQVVGVDPSEMLDRQNLELNISCGNLVLIIDGLDEIESALKDRFLLDEFVASAMELNGLYDNCTIFITFRDYYAPRFIDLEYTSLYLLPGFSDTSIEKYLQSRFPNADQRREAVSILQALAPIRAAEDDYLAPIYLALIANIVDCRKKGQQIPVHDHIGQSSYFLPQSPIDLLVHNLLTREIAKQSLAVTPDQYFELLREISLEYRGRISKKNLDEYVETLFGAEPTSDKPDSRYRQIYVSPLLQADNASQSFTFKYDYLDAWVKARFVVYQFRQYVQSKYELSKALINTLAELCYGSGDLFVELVSLKNQLGEAYDRYASRLMKELVRRVSAADATLDQIIQFRRAISGLTYLVLSDKHGSSKEQNTQRLIQLFGGQQLMYLTVYGEFFPIDFTGLKIWHGAFERFGKFSKCTFPKEGAVFFACSFRDIDPVHAKITNDDLFDPSCNLNDALRRRTHITKQSSHDLRERLLDDLLRVIKVGYRGSTFHAKPDSAYDKVTLMTDLSIESIVRFLVSHDVLRRVTTVGRSGPGYILTKTFSSSASDAIDNRIISPDMEAILSAAINHFYKTSANH